MNPIFPRLALILFLTLPLPSPYLADPSPDPVSIAEKTRGFEKRDGFLPTYWDAREGRIWLEIGHLDREMIYIVSLATGLGSNDIGLDRSQLGRDRIVRFERVGPKILLVQPNYRFRAGTQNPEERRAVRESFARSVLWGFQVKAETGERVLVDATDFFLRDAHGVIGILKETGQGDYKLDPARSAFYLPNTKGFPRNSEIEVTLTFTGGKPGPWVLDIAPTPEALTARQRHSFVTLPEPGFTSRPNHPGAGYFGISYIDYATPLGEPLVKRFIARHRLEKRDPAAPLSEAVEPIVYYLDRGVPEPVRSALLDGARWWTQAFEAAGYRDAFRVELLPQGADPLDVRYNVIQWVHRATRGWSYGSAVIDPRTGEILKGHVLLGSLRVRQDLLLAEGLLSPYLTGDERPPIVEATALARIRQLAAHEVGHTLGLAHNYIASTAGRASVMDYPHPLAKLAEDGSIDLTDAYAAGIGAWDRVAIEYGYQDFPPGTDSEKAMEGILTGARARGITFLTDQDARPPGSPHPFAHLWDNGTDPVDELNRILKVRRAALDRFGAAAIRNGEPLATMEEALVPLYYSHRYQVIAAAKVIGGQSYTYALRGDGQIPVTPVPAADQARALEALLATLGPEELVLPASVLATLPPRPFTYPAHRELFPRFTGLAFDPIAPAAVAADMTLSMILQPERAARLVEQRALDRSMPGLASVIDRILGKTLENRPDGGYPAEVNRAVGRVAVERLMELAATAPMSQVRAIATLKLDRLQERLGREIRRAGEADQAHFFLLAADIRRFLDREFDPERKIDPPAPPPGGPIGASGVE